MEDGSRHDWLEGPVPWLSLLAYIDYTTGEVAWLRTAARVGG